jgi:hypothetical protein
MIALLLTTPRAAVLVGELSHSIARFAPRSGPISYLLCRIGALLNSGNPLGQFAEIVNLRKEGQLLRGFGEREREPTALSILMTRPQRFPPT